MSERRKRQKGASPERAHEEGGESGRRHFAITGRDYGRRGIVFDVARDATEEEICEEAWAAVAEHVSFGWAECDERGNLLDPEDDEG